MCFLVSVLSGFKSGLTAGSSVLGFTVRSVDLLSGLKRLGCSVFGFAVGSVDFLSGLKRLGCSTFDFTVRSVDLLSGLNRLGLTTFFFILSKSESSESELEPKSFFSLALSSRFLLLDS